MIESSDRSDSWNRVLDLAQSVYLVLRSFFLEMVYPHHGVVFKRATVEDPERVLHLTPDTAGIRGWKTYVNDAGISTNL